MMNRLRISRPLNKDTLKKLVYVGKEVFAVHYLDDVVYLTSSKDSSNIYLVCDPEMFMRLVGVDVFL